MITPVTAFATHTMGLQIPRRTVECRAVIEHLTRSAEARTSVLGQPAAGREPTHLRIHIAADECRKRWHAGFHISELEGLCHAYGLGNRSPQIITHFVVGLHVCIDEAQGVAIFV